MYFYTTLHRLMWVDFGLSWLACGSFSIIKAVKH